MKFLFLLPGHQYNDAIWHAQSLASALKAREHEVLFALGEHAGLIELFETGGFAVEPLLAAKGGLLSRMRQSRRLKRLSRTCRPDFIITYGNPPAGWHHFKGARSVGVVWEWQPKTPWVSRLWRTVAACEQIRGRLLDRYGLTKDRIYTIHGGLDPVGAPSAKRDTIRNELRIEPKNILVGILGAVNEHSGHDLLLQAMANDYHPNLKLLAWVDTPEEIERFRQLARRYNISSIAHAQVRPHGCIESLQALDLGVIADRKPAGVARKAIELMAAGVPVVSADRGADAEVCSPENRFESGVAASLMDRIISHGPNTARFDRQRVYDELMLLLGENERAAG
ncbi:MAG: glycosyltransferase [Campylobacterales bacterium]